ASGLYPRRRPLPMATRSVHPVGDARRYVLTRFRPSHRLILQGTDCPPPLIAFPAGIATSPERPQTGRVIEIHGKRECPFAWRVRICAREKGLPFEWIPFDGPDPDPRAVRHKPEKKSPKRWEDGFELLESSVILRYLDEA